MSGTVFLHILALGFWGGCVAAEMIMEIVAWRTPDLEVPIARFHDWIDRYVELPILVWVLTTGLLLFDWNRVNGLYLLKVAMGLAAITANLVCVVVVIRRGRAAEVGDTVALRRGTRQVFLAFGVGFPCAMVALFVGLYLAGLL